MLEQVEVPFTVVAPTADEEAIKPHIKDMPCQLQALELAKAKGFSVAEANPDSIIIAADQICECDGEILSKPKTQANAIKQLSHLQARSHKQHSAVCILKNQTCLFEHIDTATLHMRTLTSDEIKAYVEHDQPLHSCGSYRLEGHGKHLFSNIEGNDDTIKGLPVISLLEQLYVLGILQYTT